MIAYYQLLGYLGLIPFVGFTVSTATGFYDFINATIFYGYVIICFLSGTHWHSGIQNRNWLRLSISMIPSICSLGLYIIDSTLLSFIVLTALFWGALLADKHYDTYSAEQTGAYLKFRLILTISVSLAFITNVIILI